MSILIEGVTYHIKGDGYTVAEFSEMTKASPLLIYAALADGTLACMFGKDGALLIFQLSGLNHRLSGGNTFSSAAQSRMI